jgi:hypothetical protein
VVHESVSKRVDGRLLCLLTGDVKAIGFDLFKSVIYNQLLDFIIIFKLFFNAIISNDIFECMNIKIFKHAEHAIK